MLLSNGAVTSAIFYKSRRWEFVVLLRASAAAATAAALMMMPMTAVADA